MMLQDLEANLSANSNTNDLKQARLNFEQELLNEEILYREKSRELWLKHGDNNTAFFKACIQDRKMANSFNLKISEEIQTDNKDIILEHAVKYYNSRFTASYH